MRMLRWAVELAGDRDDSRAAMGQAALSHLLGSNLLHGTDRVFVTAVVASALTQVEAEIPEAGIGSTQMNATIELLEEDVHGE